MLTSSIIETIESLMRNYFIDSPSTLLFLAHITIVVGLSIRVIMKRPATGVALAWLLIIGGAPFVGGVIYLLMGERRISHQRLVAIGKSRHDRRQIAQHAIDAGLTAVDWDRHTPATFQMNQLGLALVGIPTVRGNQFALFSDTEDILRRLADDIDAAQQCVLMEFYIWNEGGLADDVLAAVMRAARRGVQCCLLIDALGARPWWKGKQPQQLREAGVEIRPALPVGLSRAFYGRTDLRLHRKIVVIDSKIAWTGSMNLVDPRYFKQGAGVGEWVDAMVRLEGSVVVPLAGILISDWSLETDETINELIARFELRLAEPIGSVDIQVIPSGPGQTIDGLLQMLVALINSAEKEVTLTTPYLVPDESLLRALRGAAGRGVKVRLIVPEKVDSLLTRYASRSYYDDLLEVGIEIYLFHAGLLHTKSIVVDGQRAMFGTVNLDMRSIWLNYEVVLFVYDQNFAMDVKRLQHDYIEQSNRLDPQLWAKRGFRDRLAENTLRLFSPLL
ncbi:MAG: cardiolipin synthase [Planctomycetota bacterium]|nr:cardiolipin synthase [Planctomycetota bacterium]